jgi:uncharacterized SAM-binding protein YcdF (DUF218 family)
MYFILSKVLLFLIVPLNWIIACLLVAFFAKKAKLKRRCFIAGVVLLIVFSNQWLLYFFAKNWDVPPELLEKGKIYSAVIVLGGFSGEDKNDKGVFNNYSDRFIEGLELKEQNKASHILISSGNGNLQASSFREAAWAKGELEKFNLPDSSILIEQDSRNTFENASFSEKLLERKHLSPPYLLVTSAWHMRRALYIFKKEGLKVVACSSGPIYNNKKLTFDAYFMPDVDSLGRWGLYLKEVVGLIMAHLK